MKLSFCTLAALVASTTAAPTNAPSTFTYNRTDFLLNGHPYQLLGGQMDPQRIPQQYWGQRLRMAKAMGLNTIFSYIYWNNLEQAPGQWDFKERNDIGHFMSLAQREGLHVVLRPGPYICGEREWGGFPGWLNQVPGMAVRQNNKPFLDASKKYIERLSQEIKKYEINNGGPILMTQLENEYGSFGKDKDYLQAFADILRANFDTFLYTNDGGGKSYLDGGTLHGVLAETDGGPKEGFAARDQYVTDPTMLGPQLDGEYYTTWIDGWGSNYTHQISSGDEGAMNQITSDLDWIMAGKNSFSLYMFHGGTNFGFENGAIWTNNAALIVTSSYDYGAPLDESGRPTELYYRIRDTIAKHVPKGSIPKVPEPAKLTEVSEFTFEPVAGFLDTQKDALKKTADYPATMDSLDQVHGFVLYEHDVAQDVEGKLAVGDQPRDRVIVYVNDKRVGIIDRIYPTPATVTVSLKKGDKFQLLVENMGRIDYGQQLKDQVKGIVGNVTVNGGDALKGWEMTSIPLSKLPALQGSGYKVEDKQSPVFYKGSFKLAQNANSDLSGDTFLSLPAGIKGIVWVNGRIMGKYWRIGPQQQLYIPGCYLEANRANEVVVLELEPSAGTKLVGEGIAVRKWFNQEDPDAPEKQTQ